MLDWFVSSISFAVGIALHEQMFGTATDGKKKIGSKVVEVCSRCSDKEAIVSCNNCSAVFCTECFK